MWSLTTMLEAAKLALLLLSWELAHSTFLPISWMGTLCFLGMFVASRCQVLCNLMSCLVGSVGLSPQFTEERTAQQ